MQVIKLEIEDSKVDIVLNIVKNLKEDIVSRYEVFETKKADRDFVKISHESLEKIWNNEEDSIYDKFLKE